MQDELQHNSHAQTTHTPRTGLSYRVKLSSELIDPLCHGLGHAIYRLALTSSERPSTQVAGRHQLSPGNYATSAYAPAANAIAPSTQPLLELVTGDWVLAICGSCFDADWGHHWLLILAHEC